MSDWFIPSCHIRPRGMPRTRAAVKIEDARALVRELSPALQPAADQRATR